MTTTIIGEGARYHRVSTVNQDYGQQIVAIDGWLGRNKVATAHTLEDKRPRDLSDEGPDFQRLMGMVRARAINWVVVGSIDRLGFSGVHECFSFIHTFRQHQVRLWSASDDLCLTDADELTIVRLMFAAMTSSREQLEKAKRTIGKRIEKAHRGEYQGGLPPYGFDVICRGTDGKIKFRYVLEEYAKKQTGRKPSGHPSYRTINRGTKITTAIPQGESSDGVPVHDRGDILSIEPSIRADRLETIRRIFLWLDTESISLCQIAKRLNDEGVSPVAGELWSDAKLRPMVQNPVYIGTPAHNKKTNSRHCEIVDAQLARIEVKPPTKTRRRTPDQWILPSGPLYDPIVDPERFERVGRKVAVGKNRAPKNDRMYLRGLLHCGHCGGMMRGQMQHYRSQAKNDHRLLRTEPYFICPSYNKWGKDNPTGCAAFSTAQRKIEPLITEFLAKRGQSLDDLLSVERDRTALEKLLIERSAHDADARSLLERMRGFVRSNIDQAVATGIDNGDGVICPSTLETLDSPAIPADDLESLTIVDLYDMIIDHQGKRIRAEITRLEAEHDGLVAKIGLLTAPKLLEKLNVQAEELEGRIATLRAQLEPISDRWCEIMSNLKHLRQRIAEAETVMVRGSNRMKSEALRACIQKIVCHHDNSGAKSVLVKVEIVPQIGEPQTFEVTAPSKFSNEVTGRGGIVAKLLTMVFAP